MPMFSKGDDDIINALQWLNKLANVPAFVHVF